jgi:hypothetical protein
VTDELEELVDAPSAWHKLADVALFVGSRPVAWVDDRLGAEIQAWAASRDAPTLLVQTDPRIGLTIEHIRRLRRFGADQP